MYDLRLPRSACSPRERARAGDLWRLVQEAAVLDSTERGWPPARYRKAGTGFVVRQMTGIHLREAAWGETLRARTWVAESRRDMLVRRESEIVGVLRATAEWVHVGADGALTRGSRALIDAFPVEPDDGPGAELPEGEPVAPVTLPPLVVRPWWTEMDPMGHVNHPRYIDWGDEAISGWLHERGVDPVGLIPVADRIRFRSPATARDVVTVECTLTARIGDAGVFRLRMARGERVLVEATLHRRHTRGWSAYS